MSVTWSIVCHETKQKLWIGQNSEMRTFYSGQPETMQALGKFLQATLGKQLVVMCDDTNDYWDYEEFGEAADSATVDNGEASRNV